MKKFFLFLIIFVYLKPVQAQDMIYYIKSAYENNPKLNAERASKRASLEEQRGSYSGFLPNVTISGYVSEQDNTGTNESNFEPSEHSMKIEQKVFQGFGGLANVKKKK